MHVADVKWYTTQLCAVHIITTTFSRKCRQTAQLITFLDTFNCSALVWSCSLCSWILPLPCSIKIFSWLFITHPTSAEYFTVFLKFHVQTALLHCHGATRREIKCNQHAVFGITLCRYVHFCYYYCGDRHMYITTI